MAPSFVRQLASGGFEDPNASTNVISATVVGAATGQYNLIMVAIECDVPILGVTDSAGNVYIKDVTCGSFGANSPAIVLYSARNTKSLTVGQQITITTNGGGLSLSYVMFEWSGLNRNELSVACVSPSIYTIVTTTVSASAAIIGALSSLFTDNGTPPSISFTPGAAWTLAGSGAPERRTVGIYPPGTNYTYQTFVEYLIVNSLGSYGDSGAAISPGAPSLIYDAALAIAYYGVAPGAPAAPSFSEPTSLATLTVSCAAVLDAGTYTLESSPDNSAWSTVTSGLALPSYLISTAPTVATWYRWQAVNGLGTTIGASAQFATPTTPPAPTLANVQAPLSVVISWVPRSQLGKQRIERQLHTAGSWATIVDNLSGTTGSYSDTTVAATTAYDYRIVATNSIGVATGSLATITTLLALMQITLTVSEVPLQVSLSWATLPGTTPTYIPRRSTDNVTFSDLGPSQVGTSFVDSGVTSGTKYFYQIHGTSSLGTFDSPVAGCYSAGPVAPTAPTLGINPYFPSAVDVWWLPVPHFNPVTYAVQRSPSGAGTWGTIASGIYGTFYSDASLTASGAYDYRIVATDIPPGSSIAGYSATGTLASITVPVLAPVEPTLTQASGSTDVVALWPAVAGITSYTFQRSTDQCRTWTNVATGLAVPTATDTSRPAYTRIWYRVIAVASGGSAAGRPRSIFVDTPNLVTPGLRFVVGGSDQSAIVDRLNNPPKLDRQVSGHGAIINLRLLFPGAGNHSTAAVWQEVEVLDSRQLLHTGWIDSYTRGSESPDMEWADIAGPDAAVTCLNTTYVTEVFEQQTAGWIIRSLLARYIPGLTAASVADGPVLPYVAIQDQTVLSTLSRLLSLGVAAVQTPYFRIGSDLDCHLTFSGSLPAAPILLSDANALTRVYGG